MIDWRMVAAHALWMTGLAILLAAFSYHQWLAAATRSGRRAAFARRSWRVSRTSAGLLVAAGWGVAQTDWWGARALCIVLAVSFATELARLVFRVKQRPCK